MCYNCEGEVDLDVIVCPYCAADLREEKPEQQRPSYTPAATLKNLNTQQSLYPSHFSKKSEEEPTEEPAEQALSMESEETKNILGPILLLTLGAQLFLLGALMLLFSNHGYLTIKWDARFWFLYLFASLPLLIFGYRTVSKL